MASTHRKIIMWCIIIASMVLKIAAAADIVFPVDSDVNLDHEAVQPEYQNTEPENTQTFDKYMQSIISQGITNLCLALDRALAATDVTDSTEYMVFSPISVASALALLLLGSTGATFEEISSVLGLAHGTNIANNSELVHQNFGQILQELETSSEPKQQIKIANGIFIQNEYIIRQQYRKLSEKLYRSDISAVDFKTNAANAQNAINNWVAVKTNNKIKDILPGVPPPSTKVIIVNAIYFINEWEDPFSLDATQRKPFYSNGKNQPSTIEIDQMATGGVYPYYKDRQLDCEILGIPYKGGQTVFYVVIPNNSNRQKLRNLENSLNVNLLNKLVENVKPTPAIIAIPKMKLTSLISLNRVLNNIGLKSLFNAAEASLGILSPGIVPNNFRNTNVSKRPPSEEDRFIFARSGNIKNCTEGCETTRTERRRKRQFPFTKNIINSLKYDDSIDYIRRFLDNNKNEDFANPGLYADQIFHKVYIDVTEKGTEAAAATSVSLTRDGNRIVVKANVPFFFFIRHEQTKVILFWGSVYEPSPHYT